MVACREEDEVTGKEEDEGKVLLYASTDKKGEGGGEGVEGAEEGESELLGVAKTGSRVVKTGLGLDGGTAEG